MFRQCAIVNVIWFAANVITLLIMHLKQQRANHSEVVMVKRKRKENGTSQLFLILLWLQVKETRAETPNHIYNLFEYDIYSKLQ